MLTVRRDPLVGLIVQLVLLAILAATVGLGVAGWMTGVTYGFIMCAALTWGLNRVCLGAFGPADWVTLTRATLVGCVTALIADSFDLRTRVEVLVAIASVALALDALDGKVARRTGTVSGFGGRFDSEVDWFLTLVLSAYVARSMGEWVLAIGAMRYAFVVAGWALQWMRRPLPWLYRRKVIGASQGVMLVVATATIIPTPLMVAALAIALALLLESFGRDIAWLWRRRMANPETSLL